MPRLDHVGIAVADIDRTLQVLHELLGESCYHTEAIERDGVRVHFVSGGTAKLELIEGLRAPSPMSRFIDKYGSGLHHLAFEVNDIRETHARVRKAGYEPIDPEPRKGAGGKHVFFLHPKDTAGVLIEFCQRSRPALRPECPNPSEPPDYPTLPGPQAPPNPNHPDPHTPVDTPYESGR